VRHAYTLYPHPPAARANPGWPLAAATHSSSRWLEILNHCVPTSCVGGRDGRQPGRRRIVGQSRPGPREEGPGEVVMPKVGPASDNKFYVKLKPIFTAKQLTHKQLRLR
jgi:hypothetical protein